MNRRDIIKISIIVIIFIWLTIATMPYRLAVIRNGVGHFYDEDMSSQEFLILKKQKQLAKMKNVSMEAKWDCDEDLAKTLWVYFRAPNAVEILANIKKQRQEAYKGYNPKLINTMLLLAGAYRDVNNTEESTKVYDEIWQLDKANLLAGDSRLTRDQINLAMINYLHGDSEEDTNKQKTYFRICLEHIQFAQQMWHQEKNPDVAKLANLFFLKYLACRALGDEVNSKQAYGEMKYLNKQIKHICKPPRT